MNPIIALSHACECCGKHVAVDKMCEDGICEDCESELYNPFEDE